MASCFGFAPHKILAVFMALLIGGCVTAKYPITQRAAPAEALIQFEDPLLQDAKVVRIHHLDAFEHVAYARFETDALTLEAVYDAALSNSLVLQYDYWMERMVGTWNAHRDRAKSFGEKSAVRVWHGELEVQPFRIAGSGQSCTGFNSEWDFRPRDSFGRPGKVFFGYVCAKPGASLSEERIAKLLSSLALSRKPAEAFRTVGTQRQIDQVAFNTAAAGDGGAKGNAEFPFNFGTTIDENEGSDFSG